MKPGKKPGKTSGNKEETAMDRKKRALVGLVAATLLVAALPASAQAQTDEPPARTAVVEESRGDRLDRAKAHITGQIERRLRTIEQLTGKLTRARFVTDGHEASLLRDYSAAREILAAGLDAVADAETIEELREIAPPIFERTLVYALLRPKTHAVIASDAVLGIAERADGIADKLQMALDRIAETGVDVADAQAHLDEARRLVADAKATGGPVADAVIDLQPGDEYRQPLADAKDALQTSRSLLGDARAAMKEVVQFVRGAIGNRGSSD